MGAKATTLVVVFSVGLIATASVPAVADPEPWMEWNEAQLFMACMVHLAGTSIPLCAATDSNHQTHVVSAAEPDLRTVSVHLEWEQQAVNPEEFRLIVDDGDHTTTVSGPSPLTLRLDAGTTGSWDPKETTTFLIGVGTLDGSVAYQQPFTLSYAFHYVEPAPPGYSPAPSA